MFRVLHLSHDTAMTVTETVACQTRRIATKPRCAHVGVGATGSASILVDTMREPNEITRLGEA